MNINISSNIDKIVEYRNFVVETDTIALYLYRVELDTTGKIVTCPDCLIKDINTAQYIGSFQIHAIEDELTNNINKRISLNIDFNKFIQVFELISNTITKIENKEYI